MNEPCEATPLVKVTEPDGVGEGAALLGAGLLARPDQVIVLDPV